MPELFTVESLRFFRGSQFGITGPTALLEMEVAGEVPAAVLDELEQAATLAALNPGDALPGPGLGQGDWVSRFLIDGRGNSRLGDITAALIVALTLWARVPISRAEVFSAPEGQLRIALHWMNRAVLREAITLATDYISALADPGRSPEQIAEVIARVREFLDRVQPDFMAPNTMRFAWAAVERDMPVTTLEGRMVQIGWGANAQILQSSFTGDTPTLSARLARHKYDGLQRLSRALLPTPPNQLVHSLDEAREAADELKYPLVVKPVAMDQGLGVFVGIRNQEELERAYEAAAKRDKAGVIVERYIAGDDHRLLVVNGQLLMATRRIPGGVTGDGVSTVQALLDAVNADPRRGSDKRSILIRIEPDNEAAACLDDAGLTPQSVPEKGRFVPLRRTANISTGGTAVDVTDRVHPDIRIAAVRAAHIMGLDIAGVDFISPDISRSFHDMRSAICEVNAQPGFRPHWLSDPDRDINGEILDILFEDQPARIPVAAITGTNGKSTTAMMLQHIWLTAGKVAGVCTTAGTWVGRQKIGTGNLSGVPGAEVLLAEPGVEAVVLEMARRGLILFGHACDRYDVAAFLNVQDDHIGQDGIESMDDMARLKAGVILRARDAVVINAEDPRCVEHGQQARAPRHILVAMDPETPALADHLGNGGDGVFVDRHEDGTDWIYMARGDQRHAVIRIADIPATLNGHLRFNVMNAMFAIALADAQELPVGAIRAALNSFESSRDMNPGRYNMVGGFAFPVIVDYAHNETGTSELCRVVQDLPIQGQRILVLRTLGSSGPAEVESSAKALISTFDRIHVLPPEDWILKNQFYESDDPIGEMLEVTRRTLLEQGAGEDQVTASREDEAVIHQVLQGAGAKDLVVLMSDPEVAFRHIDSARAAAAPGQAAAG